MVNFCAVVHCANRAGRNGKSFFRIPVIPQKSSGKEKSLCIQRRQRWITALKRKDIKGISDPKIKNLRVCEDHFQTGRPSKDKDHPDYVPSTSLKKKSISRILRAFKSGSKKKSHCRKPAKATFSNSSDTSYGNQQDASTMTELTSAEIDNMADIIKAQKELLNGCKNHPEQNKEQEECPGKARWVVFLKKEDLEQKNSAVV